jgi:hypothetical protein
MQNCNFFLQFLISYTARKWLQSAIQQTKLLETDTWMNHIFPPPSNTRIRDIKGLKLDSNRRRSSILGGFLWYHLHRQQKRLPSTAWWYRDWSYLPLRFYFVNSPVPIALPVWAITQWWIVTTKAPRLYEVTFVKARLLCILMDSISSSLSQAPSTDVSHPQHLFKTSADQLVKPLFDLIYFFQLTILRLH